MWGQVCHLHTNDSSGFRSLYLHLGVGCQCQPSDPEPALPDNERILRESLEKLRHPHSLQSHCHHRGGRGRVSIMSWLMTMMSWWLCQGLSGNYADLNLCTLVAFYLEWSAERKWNENWNEHPAVQCTGCAAQVQANINCSQSAYLQIWNRYLHWKVGMF